VSGWIEVGRRKEAGFVARALDGNTLAGALAALEVGLAGRFKDHASALRSSPLKVNKRQRRLRNDA